MKKQGVYLFRSFRTMLILAVLILFEVHLLAQRFVLFDETFSSDLNSWTGRHGGSHNARIVIDPLDPSNRVLIFVQLNVSGDLFKAEAIQLAGFKRIYLLFDYLGLPQFGSVSGNLGGFVGLCRGLDLDRSYRFASGIC